MTTNSSNIVALELAPSVEEEVQQSLIKILEEALELVREGQVSSGIVILNRVDGCWHERFSETISVSRDVGRLEIIKQKLISKFLQEDDK